MRKLNASTRHHHSFVSNIQPDIHLIFTPANITRISHGIRIRQKSTGKAQTEAWRLLVLPFTRKRWIENVEMRQKTVQSHCNNVRRQPFHKKRALARTRYEAFGATEGFGKYERESREFQRAAKKNCSRYNSNNYEWVCSGTSKINPCLQPSQITIDFEIACLLAFEELFLKVSIKGKYIFRPHFNSFQRKLVSLLFLQVASSTSPKPIGARYKTLDWKKYTVNKWKLELW